MEDDIAGDAATGYVECDSLSSMICSAGCAEENCKRPMIAKQKMKQKMICLSESIADGK